MPEELGYREKLFSTELTVIQALPHLGSLKENSKEHFLLLFIRQ